MKWIFTILVVLNLIVFGSMMVQKMLLKHLSADNEPTRTIVIQTPPAPPPAAPPAVEKKTEKPKTAAKPKAQAQRNTPTAALPPAEPRRCGGATVTLKENDYHRIKGLLAQWPNAASRDVARNTKAGNTVNMISDYWVIVPTQNNSNEQIAALAAKGFSATQESGMTVLGKFPARTAADALRQKAQNAGLNANVMEKMREGAAQPLSVVTYNVAFLKIDDNDAARLNDILKPYAPLRRNPCK
ncbi:MAG: hypothetical protein Q4G42_07170 [Neisseria sp.]|nr:hypothetical protein [Neisseria sp.]